MSKLTVAKLKHILRNLPKGSDDIEISIMGTSKQVHIYLIDNENSNHLLIDEEPSEQLFNDWQLKDGTVKEIKF